MSRRQLTEAGWTDSDIRRGIRRRELASVHRGVYVAHTGPLSWEQRAWAAVLFAWPAALCDVSALRAFDQERNWPADEVIHVAVDRGRTVRNPGGAVVHHLHALDGRVAWNLTPPRLQYDEAVIDVAARQDRTIDAVATLADAVGSRRTTAARLTTTIKGRGRVRNRRRLLAVLGDIESGTWSVLEHGYLRLVERPHGLPPGSRQVRHVGSSGTRYRDVEVTGLAVIELDGRRFHSGTRQRDLDLERDLDAAAESLMTLRLGYGQVFDRPCQTAAKVAAILIRLGWDGRARACGPACTAVPHFSVTR